MTDAEVLYRVRAVTSDDARVLGTIDSDYAASHGLEVTATQGSASYHSRTGHSFVAELAGEPHGFILASAIWTGGRPLVRIERLALAAHAASSAAHALVSALVKSAYDAGVYDLLAELPDGDDTFGAALLEADFTRAPVSVYSRTLGSRGRAAT